MSEMQLQRLYLFMCVRGICASLCDMKSKRDEGPTMKVLVLVCVSEGNMGKL